jgi:anti-anti-sigma factor
MDTASSLRIDVHERADGGVVARLDGELDMATTPQVHALAAEHTAAPELVLDLRELVFMDSTGLRALLQLKERCAGNDQRLLLVPGRGSVQRVLAITGMEDVFEFAEPDGAG